MKGPNKNGQGSLRSGARKHRPQTAIQGGTKGRKLTAQDTVNLSIALNNNTQISKGINGYSTSQPGGILQNSSVRHFRGSSAAAPHEFVGRIHDGVTRHQRTNTTLIGRDYGPASKVGSGRLNIGRGHSATRNSKNFGLSTDYQRQNLNEQSFAQIGQLETDWRSQRPQSGYTRPQSGYQSFIFKNSPDRRDSSKAEDQEDKIFKQTSLSQYINKLQSEHVASKGQTKSRTHGFNPFMTGFNGSPKFRVLLNQSMSNDQTRQQYLNSYQQSLYEKNESQISSYLPKYGKPNIGNSIDQDFGVAGRKIDIKTFVETIPANALQQDIPIYDVERTGMLIENRRRTIILNSVNSHFNIQEINYEDQVLSEQDRKNFSIVNIQALADPFNGDQTYQQPIKIYQPFQPPTQDVYVGEGQPFAESRISMDTVVEKQSNGTMRVSVLLQDGEQTQNFTQNPNSPQPIFFKPSHPLDPQVRQSIEDCPVLELSEGSQYPDDEAQDQVLSSFSSGCRPTQRNSKQIKQMEKLATLIEQQQKLILKELVPVIVEDDRSGLSKNFNCQVSEDKLDKQKFDGSKRTETDQYLVNNCLKNGYELIQEEDEIYIIKDKTAQKSLAALQDDNIEEIILDKIRPRSSQGKTTLSLIPITTLRNEEELMIDMKVCYQSKQDDPQTQQQQNKEVNTSELQEINYKSEERRFDFSDYHEHTNNIADMHGLEKQLAKKKRLFRKKKQNFKKGGLINSFEGSNKNQKISKNPQRHNSRDLLSGLNKNITRNQHFLQRFNSNPLKELIPGAGDSNRVIISKQGSRNMLIRSSIDHKRTSKVTKSFVELQEDANEIEEAIQARVQLKVKLYEQEQAIQRKQQGDVKATNRLSTALRVKNGGNLFHLQKSQTGRKQPKELGLLAARAKQNSVSRFGKSKTNSRAIIDLDDAGLSLVDYAKAHSTTKVFQRKVQGNNKEGTFSFQETQPKICFDIHFQMNHGRIKDQPFRQKDVRSSYLQTKEIKPNDPEADGQFKSIDSIMKQTKAVPFDLAVHSRAPADKKNLRYSKFTDPQPMDENFGEEIDNSKLFGNKNGFEKNKIQSNKIRQIFKENTQNTLRRRKKFQGEQSSLQKALGQLPSKPVLTKQEKLDKLGNQEIDYNQHLSDHLYSRFNDCFDPMRLKIIMFQKDLANPFGKSPDYFFVKGLDYLNANNVEQAIKSFEKGVHDKSTHLLCRFNLGCTLFKVGHFQAAANHYETLANQCFEMSIHPVRFHASIMYNKTVCELQSGYFLKAAASAAKCIKIIKEQQHANGGNILSIPKREQELLIDMFQLRGLALFRGAESKLGDSGLDLCKLGGQSLEQADVQLAIIEQHERELATKKEESKIRSDQSQQSPTHSVLPLNRSGNMDNSQEEGGLKTTFRKHAGLTIEGFGNIRQAGESPGLGERSGSVAHAGTRQHEIQLDTMYDGEQTGPIRNRNYQDLNLNELGNQSFQHRKSLVLKNENSALKLESAKRSVTSISRNSRQRSRKSAAKKKQSVNPDFEEMADQANDALNLNNLNMESKQGRGIKNIKKQADSQFQGIKTYLNDFRDRLEASIRAVASGNDEVRAFRDGDKDEGAEVKNDADSDAEVKNQKKTNRLTYRNTQRGKSRNQLEMEVEKDLTHLKNLLYKKRELKKKFNKQDQIITLNDKAQLKKMMLDLDQMKQNYIKSQDFMGDQRCLSLEYPNQVIVQIMDIVTKYREVRESWDDKKREWILQRGIVDYKVLKRGDILFEQDIDICDAQYIIVGGKVSLIKTFVDHELIFQIKQESRLERTIAGEDASDSRRSVDQSDNPGLLDAILEVNEPNMGPAEISSSSQSDNESMESVEKNVFSSSEISIRSDNKIEPISKETELNNQNSQDITSNDDIQKISKLSPTSSSNKFCLKLQDQNKNKKYGEFLNDLSKLQTPHSNESESNSNKSGINLGQDQKNSRFEAKLILKKEFDTKKSDLKQKQLDKILINNRQLYDFQITGEIDQRGVVVHPVNLKRGDSDVKISIVEYSHYQGQFFGNDTYLDWKELNFNRKIIEELNVMIQDKCSISGYVKAYLKKEAEREAAELVEFQKLSIVRQETIKQSIKLGIQTLAKSESSEKKTSLNSTAFPRDKSVVLREAFQNASPTLKSLDGQDYLEKSKSSPLLKKKSSNSKSRITRPLNRVDSKQSITSQIGLKDELSPEDRFEANLEALNLHPQETEDIQRQISGYDNTIKSGSKLDLSRHRSTIVMNRVISRMDALKAGYGDDDSQADNGPWPLTKLKREHTCLVMEDDTLVVKIPYCLEKNYIEHLQKIREEEIDH